MPDAHDLGLARPRLVRILAKEARAKTFLNDGHELVHTSARDAISQELVV